MITRDALTTAIIAIPAALVVACGSSASETQLTLHVDGPVMRTSQGDCVFVLRAALREGGSQRTCLTNIDGFPSPDSTMHSRGVMTFVLPRGTVVFRVRVRQRFAADGAHARQTLSGFVVRGRGAYAGADGSIRGRGDVVDSREALRVIRLEYTLTLKH